MALRARAIRHSFSPNERVLDGIDVLLDAGRAVALIGPNGAGKTTLLRILAGILTPTRGTVELDDEELARFDRRRAARAISVVPQTRPAAFAFTALEFVLMGFHARSGRFSLDGPERRDAALAALDRLGVARFADRSMTTLSGGEAQRVVMARTVVSGAKYWLLDEPTASLDVAHQVALLKVMREHCDRGGAALAIAHDVNLVEHWFDEVLVLSGGTLIATGSPGDTLDSTVLQQAYGIGMRRVGAADGGAWIPDLDPPRSDSVETTGPGGER